MTDYTFNVYITILFMFLSLIFVLATYIRPSEVGDVPTNSMFLCLSNSNSINLRDNSIFPNLSIIYAHLVLYTTITFKIGILFLEKPFLAYHSVIMYKMCL